ncbi:MAG: 30S ribosomal protein S4 [Methanomassiliicoccales archaeon]|uniref:30S ribosomal protein S4 n=1 Tax=Candidatus Methanarcanum hacksteinii TaxID=2911857 RepID=UPI0015ACFF0E|nr:30S ribosomal protein S4 [Methanomassiliicoccales archaeon]MDD7478754.1 30S ribosomal protein S4 [Methanomassiliicoccales archaeon]MDY4579909.1 30S ribosomal protein S4 [Candidatus Methanarcanum hacksteinii]TQS78006.1 MAG: 30S ribosomal protein S4 [Candidatus Methanarcanum hacksteinii]
MGDPKFSRRSYDTPSHPWQGERIKAEVVLVNQYGLKNKTEVWKAQSVLRNFRKQSRELQARLRSGDAQAKIEADALLNKCSKIGVLPVEGATLNDILTLSEENILSRRLQTLVFEKGMASTVGQARQMIVHGHIFMNGHRVTIPGYIVTRYEESSIMYDPASPFNDEMHPMRISAEQAAANAELKASKEAEEAAKKAAEARADAEEAGITADDAANQEGDH